MPSLLHGQAEAGGHRRPRRALRAPLRQARGQEEELTELDRSGLYRAKLATLVAGHWGEADREPSGFPHGTGLRAGDEGWVLAEDRALRALGPALTWARREGVTRLHVLVDAPDGPALARRAREFREPPAVWSVDGRNLSAAEPAPAEVVTLTPEVAAFTDVIEAAGAEAVPEGGTLLAEVLGLEVGRVVATADGPRFEVGVGKHDRWAQLEVHGDGPVLERLIDAVRVVRAARVPGGSHPFAVLALERWLRSVVIARPSLVGASELTARPSPVLRDNLRERAPAPAAGCDDQGAPVVVVCSIGVDVDLVPVAADARLAFDPAARLVIAVPEGDDHRVTRDLAAALNDPAEIVTVSRDWQTL